MWTEFHFLRPWWLLALLPLVFLLIAFARRRFEMRRWQNVVDAALMPHVLIGAGQGTRRYMTLLLALAGLFGWGMTTAPRPELSGSAAMPGASASQPRTRPGNSKRNAVDLTIIRLQWSPSAMSM